MKHALCFPPAELAPQIAMLLFVLRARAVAFCRGKMPLPVSRICLALLAAMTLGSTAARANCWRDAALSARTLEIAQRHFPSVALRMPTVLVCGPEVFPYGGRIGGDYTSGIHRIRIPVWQLNRPELTSVLAHELAHAHNAVVDGIPDGGHSVAFMRALVNAGFAAEASRVAAYTGEWQALAAAGGQHSPPRSPPPAIYVPAPPVAVLVCRDTVVVVHFFDPRARMWRPGTQIQRHCWHTVQ